MFVDSVTIRVQGGNGGEGAVSFRREKYVPKGGPDGGDGGNGGGVTIKADEAIDSLSHLLNMHTYAAEDGRNGEGKKKSGASGPKVTLSVPPGTTVTDVDNGIMIKKMMEEGTSVYVAEGGKGGRGNARFATPQDRVPRRSQKGLKGRKRTLLLECRLAANVAIVGQPNSGKSSLLDSLTSANPETADYPFTTKQANIGEMALPDYTTLLLVDLPAIIEGSHEGAGFGNSFLRHAERAQLIIITADVSREGVSERIETVRRELECYSPKMFEKRWIVVCTKTDLGPCVEPSRIAEQFGVPAISISTTSSEGIDKLVELLVSYGLKEEKGQ